MNSIISYGEEVVEQVKVDIDEDAEEGSDMRGYCGWHDRYWYTHKRQP